MDVARNILKQLGGNHFVVATGASKFLSDGNTLRMHLPRNKSGANRLYITLNGKDLYDMKFFRYTAPRFNAKTGEFVDEKITREKTYTDVYADMLRGIFEQYTWLYTSL